MFGKSTRTRTFLVISSSLTLLAVGAIVWAVMFFAGARASFRRLVIFPIPRSVGNIKADRSVVSSFRQLLQYGYREHVFVLRFDISREDLSTLIAARGFKRWEDAGYRDRVLVFKVPEGYLAGVNLYSPKSRQLPSWFDLEAWCRMPRTGIETYIVGQDTIMGKSVNVSLLLFNEQLGSAYLIKWERRGPRR